MIPFNKPVVTGKEQKYLAETFAERHFCGGGKFSEKCSRWIEKKTGTKRALMTTSCTDALEMSAILADIQPGDEVIMPSFTFVSTATAFVLRGAHIKFVDIRPDTMNIDESRIEEAITPRTKAIVPVHYAGVGCEMDTINDIAKLYNLLVIEDAAQGVLAYYKGKPLGSIGDLGCYSFHETKNVHSGEGGALLVNNKKFIYRAEIIYEKGTNRLAFSKGFIDKYTWIDIGSSFLSSELNNAFLYAQLEDAEKITNKRLQLWNRYYENLKHLEEKGILELPKIPKYCHHNGHIFYIKVRNKEERSKLMEFLEKRGIQTTLHYIPLHSSPAGKRFGEFVGKDIYTTRESERLLRLPMFYDLTEEEVDMVCDYIDLFFTHKLALYRIRI
ncbi:MAG: dTDP-4-amino-4,6-dideoxygalactose transaminase [Aquificae bacterium]|nr:dTDP-4-amino-4,6-dideoxygalactose transaminase [Aquificota bacterium]